MHGFEIINKLINELVTVLKLQSASDSWQQTIIPICSASTTQNCQQQGIKQRQDLADRRMANPTDPVLGHYTPQKQQPAAVPELLNNQPSKQSHAEDNTEQIKAARGKDHR